MGGDPGGLVRAGSPDTQAITMAGSSTLAELDEPPPADGRQGGNDRTQGNDPSGVPLSAPPSGGYTKLPLPPQLLCQVIRGSRAVTPRDRGRPLLQAQP